MASHDKRETYSVYVACRNCYVFTELVIEKKSPVPEKYICGHCGLESTTISRYSAAKPDDTYGQVLCSCLND